MLYDITKSSAMNCAFRPFSSMLNTSVWRDVKWYSSAMNATRCFQSLLFVAACNSFSSSLDEAGRPATIIVASSASPGKLFLKTNMFIAKMQKKIKSDTATTVG